MYAALPYCPGPVVGSNPFTPHSADSGGRTICQESLYDLFSSKAIDEQEQVISPLHHTLDGFNTEMGCNTHSPMVFDSLSSTGAQTCV